MKTENIEKINRHFQSVAPRNAAADQLYRSWCVFYENLSWFDREYSDKYMHEALARVQAYDTANGTSKAKTNFGVEGKAEIQQGSTGPDVIAWQKILGVPPTGTFDAATYSATMSYQSNHGLTADGIVGPATWGSVADSSVPSAPGSAILSALKSAIDKLGPTGQLAGAAIVGIAIASYLVPAPAPSRKRATT